MNEIRKNLNTENSEQPAETAENYTEQSRADNEGNESDQNQLAERLNRALSEISTAEAYEKTTNDRVVEEFKQLKQLWKDKFITSTDEFAALSQKISNPLNEASEKVRQKYTEYRLTRIELLADKFKSSQADERTTRLNIKDRIDELKTRDIQAGGSNAKGVFEVEGEDLIIIEKSKGTYEYDGALPYLMQDIPNERVPRVLDVFRKGDATYKVMEKAAGTQLDQLPVEQIGGIPQEHFDQFVRDIRLLNSKGLQIDPSKTSNLFYNPTKGFIFIDLADHQAERASANLPNQVDSTMLREALIGAEQDSQVVEKIRKAIE